MKRFQKIIKNKRYMTQCFKYSNKISNIIISLDVEDMKNKKIMKPFKKLYKAPYKLARA